MLDSNASLIYSSTVVADILCEFLEVAIHLILYVREVYPSGIFQKKKKYNVPVQVNSMDLTCLQSWTFSFSLDTGQLHLRIHDVAFLVYFVDVVPSRTEPVYPRYTPLCEATHRKGEVLMRVQLKEVVLNQRALNILSFIFRMMLRR